MAQSRLRRSSTADEQLSAPKIIRRSSKGLKGASGSSSTGPSAEDDSDSSEASENREDVSDASVVLPLARKGF